MKNVMRLIAVNVMVFLALIGALVTGLISVNAFVDWEWVRPADERSRLSNYKGVPWAAKHFSESRLLGAEYFSYVGWRRELFNGETITIVGDYRERKTLPEGMADRPVVYFFGGSTMFGTGADDAGTIPSHFARLTGMRARNFAESGYSAHQSLEMLLRLLQDGHRPDIVVFYDGVNDVKNKCRSELGPYSDSQEFRIRTRLDPDVGTLRYFFLAVLDPFERLTGKFVGTRTRPYDCDKNEAKAKAVAEALISDWELAKLVTKFHGIRFIAIFQPVIYFSATKKEHIPVDKPLEQQFVKVYPMMAERVKQKGYVSLTSALDAEEYLYVDFAHLSPNGNERMANRLAEIVR